jgi:hypothetical protein
MTFEELTFVNRQWSVGVCARVFFPNGYGASVIRGEGTYGGDQGLYELAVISGSEEKGWSLCYSTPITDDVIGYLEPDAVTDLLGQIEALPAKEMVN